MTAAQSRTEAASPSYDIEVEDVTYVRHGDKAYLARLYKPKGAGPFPVIVDLHGGAWCNQDRTNDKVICEALARSGVLVAALDFRMPPDAGYPASLADINYAVRWVRANAAKLKARPDKIGYIGISSGGHQAMLAAMRPKDGRYGAVTSADVPAGDAPGVARPRGGAAMPQPSTRAVPKPPCGPPERCARFIVRGFHHSRPAHDKIYFSPGEGRERRGERRLGRLLGILRGIRMGDSGSGGVVESWSDGVLNQHAIDLFQPRCGCRSLKWGTGRSGG